MPAFRTGRGPSADEPPGLASSALDQSADFDTLTDFHLSGIDNRERALPIRQGDLNRLLLAEPGLSPVEISHLERFGRLLGAILHNDFYDKLRELKELYAPIDPDSDYVQL